VTVSMDGVPISVPDRKIFRARLNDALKAAVADGREGAVMFVELDGFRLVTEIFGDASGDQLVRAAAERVGRCVRPGDTVAHMGENEFAVILPQVSRSDDASVVAEKILNALVEPFDLAGQESYIAASIGIAIFPGDGGDYQALLRNADAAMYAAKGESRNAHKFYAPELRRTVARKPALDEELSRGLENGEFVLEYEPQVDVGTGRVVGAEALIRWQNPKRGLLSPMAFMPMAEQTGQIAEIGSWVLRQACRDAVAWDGRTPADPLTVGVNASALQLNQPDLVNVVRDALAESGLAPDRLCLEITETAVTRASALNLQTLRVLRDDGVVLALDDFGTGYSSLSHLKHLPVHIVKVDQSFVSGVNKDPADTAITEAIIALAHGLGHMVIAEGVERQDQFDFVRSRQCDRVQGHLFSLPVSAERLVEFARSSSFA
jgi:diguanylate cyclase (GGDEF)-like protein